MEHVHGRCRLMHRGSIVGRIPEARETVCQPAMRAPYQSESLALRIYFSISCVLYTILIKAYRYDFEIE